jgi:hypothetical protein
VCTPVEDPRRQDSKVSSGALRSRHGFPLSDTLNERKLLRKSAAVVGALEVMRDASTVVPSWVLADLAC